LQAKNMGKDRVVFYAEEDPAHSKQHE